jgi:hypothetical protein
VNIALAGYLASVVALAAIPASAQDASSRSGSIMDVNSLTCEG